MVDFKLAALYSGTFRRVVVRTIVISAFAATLTGALWVAVIAG
jgi:hypothetical protein